MCFVDIVFSNVSSHAAVIKKLEAHRQIMCPTDVNIQSAGIESIKEIRLKPITSPVIQSVSICPEFHWAARCPPDNGEHVP